MDTDIKGKFEDEIALARISVTHLAELLMNYKDMPFEHVVAGSNAIKYLLDSIQSLSRTYHYLYRRSGTPVEEAMEELAKLPIEMD